MKILKLILMLAGAALIAFGFYTALVPQEAVLKTIAIKEGIGFNSQTIGMIGLGVVALTAGAIIKYRR